ncbi:hypothetical protein FXO38_01971 [Capsicum annuum]|nr:hypothetical protein FXO38_01971 [Capsicum annuum]
MNPVAAEKVAGLETDLKEVLNAWYSAAFTLESIFQSNPRREMVNLVLIQLEIKCGVVKLTKKTNMY